MPLFAYFALVAPALAALLFVAEAQLGPPKAKALALSTEFHGLPKPFKAAQTKTVAVLTVREAPAPDPSVLGVAGLAASGQRVVAQAAEAEAKPKTVKRRAVTKKSVTTEGRGSRDVFDQSPHNAFAQAPHRVFPQAGNAFSQPPSRNVFAPQRNQVARGPHRKHGVVW